LAGIAAERGEVGRVTTLELFFDLVFVFTITQLTAVLYHAPTLRSLVQVVLMLGVIFWMYGGYAWMTNAVSADTTARRLLLLGGMAGYFVLALAIPHAFAGSGVAFGLAYLVIVIVHTTFFMRASSASVVGAIVRLAPWNLSSALVVLAGGALGGAAQYVLWAAAFAFEWMTPIIRGIGAFEIAPAHFVERHGLVVIVAIGESVIAIGIGASHLPVDGALGAVAALGLALSACLWWLYFGGDDERAERALAAMPPVRRAHGALFGFGYWHVPMLLGIILIAAAERQAFTHPFTATGWSRAAMLAVGVAVFLAGGVLFRRELMIGRVHVRGAAAVLAVATMPLGATVAPAAQIGALVALLAATLAAEAR
jgi:low temperature requirement protein LtrA